MYQNNIIDKFLDLFNKSIINLKKQLTPILFKKITNVKKLQHITTNVLFGINTAHLISQISLLIENIKDPSLSDIDRKKIIYINKVVKKIYTIENKKELYNIFKLLSKSKPSYKDIIHNITEKMTSNFYTKNLDLNIHKHRNCLNPKIDRDIRCGIEIETAGLGKNKISNLRLGKFSCTEDASIYNYNKRTNLVCKTNDDTAELVSKIIDPYNKNDISNIYNVCETLKHSGATTNFKCGLHVHVSGDSISQNNPKILDDLLSDMVFMQKVLVKKLNIYSSRIKGYSKLIPPEFAGKSSDFVNYCQRSIWGDRYYVLNLLSLDVHDTLEFRFFNLPDVIDANIILAYCDMATSMVNSVRKKGSFCSTIQNIHSLKNIDLNNTKLIDFVYDKFLYHIDVSEDTKKILTNMDKIFSFYKAKEPKDSELNGQIIDFHTPQNKILLTPVHHINIDEDKKDILYSIEIRTISDSKTLKPVYFYPYKKVDKTVKKKLVKSTQKNVFYSKPSEKEPSYLVV